MTCWCSILHRCIFYNLSCKVSQNASSQILKWKWKSGRIKRFWEDYCLYYTYIQGNFCGSFILVCSVWMNPSLWWILLLLEQFTWFWFVTCAELSASTRNMTSDVFILLSFAGIACNFLSFHCKAVRKPCRDMFYFRRQGTLKQKFIKFWIYCS